MLYNLVKRCYCDQLCTDIETAVGEVINDFEDFDSAIEWLVDKGYILNTEEEWQSKWESEQLRGEEHYLDHLVEEATNAGAEILYGERVYYERRRGKTRISRTERLYLD